MYANIFTFIAALSLFSFYEVPKEDPGLVLILIFAIIFFYLLFFLLCRRSFRIPKTAQSFDRSSLSLTKSSHESLVNRYTVIALFFYSIIVCVFNLKGHLLSFFLLKTSNLALCLAGTILPLFLFFLMIWYCSFPLHQYLTGKNSNSRNYIESNIRLNFSIIIPWIILSFATDLLTLLPEEATIYLESNYILSLILFFILFAIIAVFFPYSLVRIWKCPAIPENSERKILENFSKKAGVNFSDMVLWDMFDSTLITAGIVGLIKQFRYLLVGPILLKILDPDELESVLAHEIGHIKNRHMFFYLFFILGYTLFSYGLLKIIYAFILSRDFLFNILFSNNQSNNNLLSTISIAIILLFILFYFRYIFGFVSRNFERQADISALELKGNADGIISALNKIAAAGSHSRTAPSWHHFSIAQRTEFLEDCQQHPGLVNKHHKRVSRIKTGYFIFLILFSSLFFALDKTVLKTSELNLYQKVIEKELEKNPVDPALHFALGNIFYEKKEYKQAEKSLLTVIHLDPTHHEALNSLAWLYATTEDMGIRKPKDALIFAETAAALAPKPHILDTLAESYYVNGMHMEAVFTIKKVIEKKPPNIRYYRKQLRKFQKALEKP
jgi:Zn-dependent protease with chaperone function